MQDAQHGCQCYLTQPTQRRLAQRKVELWQERERLLRSLFDQPHCLLRADPARHALATRFVAKEGGQVATELEKIGSGPDDDDRTRTER